MIKVPRFDGDNNDKLLNVQHDAYWDLVAWLFETARRRYLEAARLLRAEDDLTKAVQEKTTFDHRTLQDAHDLIAAHYRFTHDDGGQLRIGEDADGYRLRLRKAWDGFFRSEVRALVQDDEIALAMVKATVYENQKDGYSAESRVECLLNERYHEMSESPAWDKTT